ncbi:MAG: hypothetical protein JXR83_00255, partial [Deltaproteobacteria bacterium]|nr:hypothetical protein [Deltaproteobacteria bacterium]
VASEPVAPEPVAPEPVAAEPVAAEPVAAEPSQSVGPTAPTDAEKIGTTAGEKQTIELDAEVSWGDLLSGTGPETPVIPASTTTQPQFGDRSLTEDLKPTSVDESAVKAAVVPEPEAAVAVPEPEVAVAVPEPEAAVAAPEPEVAVAVPEPEAAVAAPKEEAISVEPALEDPLADWGSAFDVDMSESRLQVAGELLTSPRPDPVDGKSGWDADSAAVSPVALAGQGDTEDEYLVPVTGEHRLGQVEPRPTPAMSAVDSSQRAPVAGDSAATCDNLMRGARELFELGNFSESLELVEKVLATDPENGEAREYLERNQETLLKMYESKIGSFQRAPRVLIPPDEVIWLNLHHRAGFLLSQIDGQVTYEDLLALSAMSKLETCKILVQLINEGVIASS